VLDKQLGDFRDGGKDVEFLLDLNFTLRPRAPIMTRGGTRQGGWLLAREVPSLG
jgi:hypothetical protein